MGGLCDFSVSPSPNWTFGFWTALVLGFGLGLGGLDFGLGLDNNPLPKDSRVKVRRFPMKMTFFMQLVGTYLKK